MKQFKTKLKNKKRRFLSMLFDTLDESLLGNILADKGMDSAGERFIRAGYGYSIKKKNF